MKEIIQGKPSYHNILAVVTKNCLVPLSLDWIRKLAPPLVALGTGLLWPEDRNALFLSTDVHRLVIYTHISLSTRLPSVTYLQENMSKPVLTLSPDLANPSFVTNISALLVISLSIDGEKI